jgi:asparagine synthase (glutamine-hydrolysing)
MGYRYIALIQDPGRKSDVSLAIEKSLSRSGLQRHPTAGAIQLFVAPDTPILTLADGVIIGHLFERSGTRIVDGLQVPICPGTARPFKSLLDDYWGEYLAIQSMAGQETAVAVIRDPSGGVPCVYSTPQNGSAFLTSDVSLAESIGLYRRRVDWDNIRHSLSYPNQTTSRTGLADVSVLLPGCMLRLAGQRVSTDQDWNPWDFVSPARRHTNHREASAELRQTVESAVKGWADVDDSILLELSGGLDSSIVASCLRGTSAPITCCTLVTPTPGADERQYASLMADELGVELQTEMLDFEQARFSFVPPCSTVSPRIGALQYAIDGAMSAAADRHGAASFFSGSGGDTVFCYLTNAAPAADALKERGLAEGFSAIRDLSTLHQCTLWNAARLTLKKLLRPPKAQRSPASTFIHPSSIAATPDDHPWFNAPADALPGDRERIAGLVDTHLFRETAPRAVQRWRRMPLLAQPVVETCLRTPSWMWIAGGENRAVARAAFSDVLPEAVLKRRSKGNFISYLGGVYRRNKVGMRDFLLSGLLQEHRLLNAKALNRFMDREDLPIRDGSFLEIFDLCTIENWLRHQR